MSKKSLLIVDGDTYCAGIYAIRFVSSGWKVWVEESILAAKKRLKRCSPEVVIVALEAVDEALVFLSELREDPKMSRALQIVLARLGDRKTMLKVQEAGVDKYLLNGQFAPSEAVKKVKRFLEEKSV